MDERITSDRDDDGALVAAAIAGDLGAFESLVRRHQKRMLNVAFQITGDSDEACEAVQEAFLSAYKNLKRFRAEAKLSTWLMAIAINCARNRRRQAASRRARIPLSLDAPLPGGGGATVPDPPSNDPSALERIEEGEIRRRVQGCIDALDADFKEVLVLRDLQDFSYEEIGETLRLPSGTVKSRLSRAREAVKDCLKRTMGGL